MIKNIITVSDNNFIYKEKQNITERCKTKAIKDDNNEFGENTMVAVS